MKLLLDTHVLLWWLNDSAELSDRLKSLIADPENLVYVSAVSLWEIVIKESLGKLKMPKKWELAVQDKSFRRLTVTWEHALKVAELPEIHRDPFDRLLVAQALVEGLTLITNDDRICRYPGDILNK